MSRSRKGIRALAAACLALAAVVQLCLLMFLGLHGASFVVGARLDDPADLVAAERIASLRILDRNAELLREPTGGQGDRGRWVGIEELPVHMPLAVLAAEDERFMGHNGVDHLALGRAIVQNAASLRIVSGASTVTQQLVKLALGGIHDRTPRRKLLEMAASMHVERHLSKEEILEAYLNWVPYGHLTRGVSMASHTYFRKPPSHLTLSESAALAALLRAPGALDPYTHRDRLEKRRVWVLGRMREKGWIDEASLSHAVSSPPGFLPPSPVFRAPHLADEILERTSRDRLAAGEVVTTIDLDLQRKAEHMASRIVEGLGPLDVTNGAIVVIHNPTAEVLAWVGSAGYFDSRSEGMNDGVTARRSPGSALKPFVYARALESGYTPASLFEDVETTFPTPNGPYRPRNYDGLYHGPVLLRQALGSSYNVPAVSLAAHLGPDGVLESLHDAGFDSLDRDAGHYGAAIALGDGEVTLLELAAAYSALARGGHWQRPVLVRAIKDASGRTVPLDPPASHRMASGETAYLITSILSDPAARAPAFGQASVFDAGYPVAVKTGTSHDYRDNWAVGYTPEITVAVWVGNFDGTPMGNISGITGAGPLFREIMDLAMSGSDPRPFPRPDGIRSRRVCALSGGLPGPGCSLTYEEEFMRGTEPAHSCPIHQVVDGAVFESYPESLLAWAEQAGRPILDGAPFTSASRSSVPEVIHPTDGALFAVSPDVPPDLQILEVKLAVPPGSGHAVLIVDGKKAGGLHGPPWVFDWVLQPGEHVLAAKVSGRETSPVKIFVE